MRINDFMLIFKVIFIFKVLKITNLPSCLHCVLFLLLYDDHVFTLEHMIIHAIELPSDQLEDENILFCFKYFVFVLCKYLKSL